MASTSTSALAGPGSGKVLQHTPGVSLIELRAFHRRVAQHQTAIARQVDIDDFDIGIDEADIVLPCQLALNPTIAAFIVDGVDLDADAFGGIVVQVEHAEAPHQRRAQELADEALIAIVIPDLAQHPSHRRSLRCPGTIRRSSSPGLVTMRSISCIIAKPSA